MSKKFKLTFLGTAAAFTVGECNFQSNALLETSNGERLLIDCGTDCRVALFERGYTYKDIEHVYISHLHADHVGGLEWLALTRYFDPSCGKPHLYISSAALKDLWDHVLSGGLRTLEALEANLDTFFHVHSIEPNNAFVWSGVSFQLVQVVHVMNNFEIMPCFGLMFNLNGTKVFYTADTQFAPHQMSKYYEIVDLIFHDCETMPTMSGVHAHYSRLRELPPEVRKKMWLYHYQSRNLPDAKADGFLGFVKKAQQFDF